MPAARGLSSSRRRTCCSRERGTGRARAVRAQTVLGRGRGRARAVRAQTVLGRGRGRARADRAQTVLGRRDAPACGTRADGARTPCPGPLCGPPPRDGWEGTTGGPPPLGRLGGNRFVIRLCGTDWMRGPTRPTRPPAPQGGRRQYRFAGGTGRRAARVPQAGAAKPAGRGLSEPGVAPRPSRRPIPGHGWRGSLPDTPAPEVTTTPGRGCGDAGTARREGRGAAPREFRRPARRSPPAEDCPSPAWRPVPPSARTAPATPRPSTCCR
jgi:hypothetical protein